MFKLINQTLLEIEFALATTATEDYVRAVGFVATLGVALYLFATNQPIPNGLQILLSAFMGVYIGSTYTALRQARSAAMGKKGGAQ
jgi:hypothetical protein